MAAPNLSPDDFTQQLMALLPTGRVWPRDLGTTIRAAVSGLAQAFARHLQRSNNLLVDSFPSTTLELLPEWEESLGLPDPCAGQSPTIEARRAQVVARFSATGGQTAAYFIAFAAALRYTITITEYAPFRAGINRVGDPLYGTDWAYTWTVNAVLNQVEYFRTGVSAVGEPLAYWSNAVLECELNAIKPADLILTFKYH